VQGRPVPPVAHDPEVVADVHGQVPGAVRHGAPRPGFAVELLEARAVGQEDRDEGVVRARG
jgi:hypothetical protein